MLVYSCRQHTGVNLAATRDRITGDVEKNIIGLHNDVAQFVCLIVVDICETFVNEAVVVDILAAN